MSLWMAALAAEVPPSDVETILDVGCGTGRFAAQLADTFGAAVIGIDPSETMLARAEANVRHPRVTFRNGNTANLPVEDGSACLLYLSMVYHHIGDRGRAAREFSRALRPGGFLCIRNSTRDLLDQVPYLDYFPEALELNRDRLPPKSHFISTMRSAGFSLVSHEVVEQEFADTFRAYCDKIAQRGLSDLSALPDAEFDAGVRRMRADIERRERSGPILEPVDLFVFKRGTEPAAGPDAEHTAGKPGR